MDCRDSNRSGSALQATGRSTPDHFMRMDCGASVPWHCFIFPFPVRSSRVLHKGMVKRVFVGWEEPVVDLVADWLLERRGDLPGMCVVVPTTQSGRRLRERLTEKAGAVLSPEMVTPAWVLRTDGAASPAWLETVAWCEVLESVEDWTEFEGLFPQAPDLVAGEAHDLAKELQGLTRRLQDNGHTLASAARMLGSSHDSERWACLARLEGMFRKKLGSWGGASRADVLARRGRTT